ncbi:MAG TPA: hypothetical protein VLS89_05595 [Candidatus Nanopelagicales bacterium]|nr:hypothetical protein [Candidatus Nanopelagicales bacterium]
MARGSRTVAALVALSAALLGPFAGCTKDFICLPTVHASSMRVTPCSDSRDAYLATAGACEDAHVTCEGIYSCPRNPDGSYPAHCGRSITDGPCEEWYVLSERPGECVVHLVIEGEVYTARDVVFEVDDPCHGTVYRPIGGSRSVSLGPECSEPSSSDEAEPAP